MNKIMRRIVCLVLLGVMVLTECVAVFAAPSDHAFPYQEATVGENDGIIVDSGYTTKKVVTDVKVFVDLNGADITESGKEQVAEAVAGKKTMPKLQKEGETFTGWTITYVNSKGKTKTVKVSKVTSTVLKKYSANGEVTVKANFKPNVYKISVAKGKASGLKKTTTYVQASGSSTFNANDTIDVDALIAYYSEKTGKEVKGIKLSKNGYTYTAGCGKTIKYNSGTTKLKTLTISLVF